MRKIEVFMAATALGDLSPNKRDGRIVSQTLEQLYQIMFSDNELKDCFHAGMLVGMLGDKRFSEDKDNMVTVPAGEFIRGSDRFENTKPVQRIYLDAYMIGKYTVTNQEFKRFIDDGGYFKDKLWTIEGWHWRNTELITEPFYWHDNQWNGPNFPVVGISWYEAVAYANWMEEVTGKPYHLPTEAEWEKAARGTDGREYPWGNDFDKNLCNSDLSALRRTSPVGIFPGGKSPAGCFDMAGNVFEWCIDRYNSEYYKKSSLKNPTGSVRGTTRTIRGGSWITGMWTCASTYRHYHRPESRLTTQGFRVAMTL